jgi:snRNA-activating protein complex (SNAPc), subunit 3
MTHIHSQGDSGSAGLHALTAPLLTIAYNYKGFQRSGTHVYEVLGDHTLATLAQALICPYKHSNAPHIGPPDGSSNNSGFFCIDGQLYVPDPEEDPGGSIDHMLDWIGSHVLGLGPSAAVAAGAEHWTRHSMRDVKFNDVHNTLGGQFFYQHGHGCVHSLIVVDVRLISQAEAHARGRAPPQLVLAHPDSARRCFVCKLHAAVCRVYGDDFGDADPMLYCDECYHMAHYTADGQLRPERHFRRYPQVT